MPARSLFQLAMKRCITNYKNITDIGDLSYEMVKPILAKVDNAVQLYELEQNSPHLIGEDAELWRAIIIRDVPKPIRDQYDSWEPVDPKHWYRNYRKLKKEADKNSREALAAFGQKMKEIGQEKQDIVMKQVNGIPKGKLKRGHAAPKRQVDLGKDLITKLRDDLKNNTPTSKLLINPQRRRFNVNDKRVVTQAPAAMLQDYKADKRAGRIPPKPAQPAQSPLAPRPAIQRVPVGQKKGTMPDVMAKRQQSDAQLASMGLDGGNNARKRPAPTAAISKPGGGVFIQPKRRKLN